MVWDYNTELQLRGLFIHLINLIPHFLPAIVYYCPHLNTDVGVPSANLTENPLSCYAAAGSIFKHLLPHMRRLPRCEDEMFSPRLI